MRQRKHSFLDRHTIGGLLLLTFGGFFFSEGAIGMAGMGLLMRAGFDYTTGLVIGGSVGGLVLLLLWWKWFSPEYCWKSSGEDIRTCFLLLSPILLFWVLLHGMNFLYAGRVHFASVTLSMFFTALMAGVVEEVIFREMAVSYLARQWREESRILLIVFLPGLLFGLTHLGNAFSTGRFSDTLYQVLLCILTGIFYSAIYLRTGTVGILILTHFLHDLIALSAAEGLGQIGITDLPDWIAVYMAVLEALCALYGLFLIRKAKRPEILKFWDRKWSRE